MKILLIGSGAREHAMARALYRAPSAPTVCCYATQLHPGLTELSAAYCTGDICDAAAITRQAQAWGIDLAVIGPEAPLQAGVADALWAAGISVIGPRQSLARIETSKFFARELMRRHKIPGAPRYQFFNSCEGVQEFLELLGESFVIKADGLVGGKGVKVSGEHLFSVLEGHQFCQSMVDCGMSFLIEEKFIGQEFSLMGFCDGRDIFFMPLVQDHKRVWAGDRGPNTGGMGSYSDADHSLPFLEPVDLDAARAISRSVLKALQKECNQTYHGILYGSFMATRDGVAVIEFNARFGDPEALNVLSILESDFSLICEAMANGTLSDEMIKFSANATVCKYVVPEGYPDNPVHDREINVSLVRNQASLYLGAVYSRNGQLYTGASRTAAVVGVAETLQAAEKIAEADISLIQGPLFHREDIGTQAQIRHRIAWMQHLRSGGQ